jgi:hypothetical protein
MNASENEERNQRRTKDCGMSLQGSELPTEYGKPQANTSRTIGVQVSTEYEGPIKEVFIQTLWLAS